MPIANVIAGFDISDTVPTHQDCLIAYRRVRDLGKHPGVPMYYCVT